jgi:hypothetical protein
MSHDGKATAQIQEISASPWPKRGQLGRSQGDQSAGDRTNALHFVSWLTPQRPGNRPNRMVEGRVEAAISLLLRLPSVYLGVVNRSSVMRRNSPHGLI